MCNVLVGLYDIRALHGNRASVVRTKTLSMNKRIPHKIMYRVWVIT